MSVEAAALHINRYTGATVEAGHAYANPDASPLGQLDRIAGRIGASIGGMINDRLVVPFSNWLFLDTYNGEGTVEEKVAAIKPEQIVGEYATVGYRVHKVVLESDEGLQREALDLVAAMMAADPNKQVIDPQRKRVYMLREGQAPYRLCEREKSGPNKGDLMKPTCSALDAALSLRKIKEGGPGGVLVNVLPVDFTDQQVTTRRILEVAGYPEIPIMSVFFDPKGASPLATVSFAGSFRR